MTIISALLKLAFGYVKKMMFICICIHVCFFNISYVSTCYRMLLLYAYVCQRIIKIVLYWTALIQICSSFAEACNFIYQEEWSCAFPWNYNKQTDIPTQQSLDKLPEGDQLYCYESNSLLKPKKSKM